MTRSIVRLHDGARVPLHINKVCGSASVAVCPACFATDVGIGGRNRRHDHDTHYADAHCLACSAHIGTIEVTVSTIFGIEEDESVLNGRVRVY